MVPVTAITMMNAVIASPVQRWSHKILFRNMSLSGMGVPFDVNETCGKVTGGFATGWERGTESEANAPEDGRILNRVYENKYFGFDCRRVPALFIMSDGSLWAMGRNGNGQLGDGTYNNTNRPQQIVASNVTAIAGGGIDGGGAHSLFLKSDGSLWAMGLNNFGQLGDGGSVRLSYVGVPGANHVLDHSFSLVPTTWVPQATNRVDASGMLVFTNAPEPAANNFWRIRSFP
jgi:hypothetical protein